MAQDSHVKMIIKKSNTFKCEICYESVLSSQKFKHGNNIKSFHNFCIKCITSYIQERIEANIATIKCPSLSCDETLDPLECQPLIPKMFFNQWCKSLANLYVTDINKIYCPYINCSELILNECNVTMKKCLCPGCKRFICYQCRVPWHAGFCCSESHLKRDHKEIQFGRLMEKMKWTRCPSCGQPIERRSGCKNVRCRCGKKFCYDCGSESHFGKCHLGLHHDRPCARRSDDLGWGMVFIMALYLFIVIGGILATPSILNMFRV